MDIRKWFSRIAGRSGQAAAPPPVAADLVATDLSKNFLHSNRAKIPYMLRQYEEIHRLVEGQVTGWKCDSREGPYSQAYLYLAYEIAADSFNRCPIGLILDSARIFGSLSQGGEREQWMQSHFERLTRVVDRLDPVRHVLLYAERDPLVLCYLDSFRCAQLAVQEAFKSGTAEKVNWDFFEPALAAPSVLSDKSSLFTPPGVKTVPIPEGLCPTGPHFLPAHRFDG